MTVVHLTIQAWLGSLARCIYARPRIIVILAIAGTLASACLAYARFKVVNNISSILDENSETNRLYRQYKKDFNVDEEYVLVIQSEDPDLNREVADQLGKLLRELGPGIGRVFEK